MDILEVLYNFNISIYLSLLFQDLHTNYITHMGKIATEQEVYNVGGKETPIINKCCTKSRAETLGCKIKSGYSYKDNQLIEQGSYEKKIIRYFCFVMNFTEKDKYNIEKGVFPYYGNIELSPKEGKINWKLLGYNIDNNEDIGNPVFGIECNDNTIEVNGYNSTTQVITITEDIILGILGYSISGNYVRITMNAQLEDDITHKGYSFLSFAYSNEIVEA